MKYRNIFLIAVIALGTSSCIDLDTPPYDRETDLDFWEKDPESALKSLNTCYTYLASMDEMLYSEAMTDNAYTKQPNDYTQNIGNGSFSTADNYVKLVWDSRFTGIRMCNQVLENIDRVTSLEEEEKNRYIGELKTLRAFHYYELYTKFGALPYTTKVLSVDESMNMPRTDKETVVQNILKRFG